MNAIETAVQMFEEGYSCSQAILAAFAPRYGLDRMAALKLAGPFGGGMGRQGLNCGAISGALMVIGLHGGRVDPEDDETRDRNDALVVEFMDRYRARNGAIMCNDLTGVDISDPVAREAGKEAGTFDRVCPNLVRHAATIVQEIIDR